MKSQPKTVRAVHANRGAAAKYRKELQTLIADMAGSVEYWIKAAYRKKPPRMSEAIAMAQDETPAEYVGKALNGLLKRWGKEFDKKAKDIAERFIQNIGDSSDAAFRAALKDAGWSVEFKMTPTMLDAIDSLIEENIGLIKSIPQEYLRKVQGTVLRAYSAGRDLETMVKELKGIYPQAQKRAEFIALDQSNKANGIVIQARQLELGITQAKWLHSHGGRVPRPDHVAADGKIYEVAKGCLISGEYLRPGQLPRCRCVCRSVLPY